MASVLSAPRPVVLEYIPSSKCSDAKLHDYDRDPFRHTAIVNSSNHLNLHPWGPNVSANTPEFDALYARANNVFLYHLWYSDKLAPYMAAEVVKVYQFSAETLKCFVSVLQETLALGIDTALGSPTGRSLSRNIQTVLDESGLGPDDQIFVRLGATSAKDTFGELPEARPSPLKSDADVILRRILTSNRCVSRLLVLANGIWRDDPGEALIIQRWSSDVERRREFRVFVYEGRVTAISQDSWCEKLGWRENYSSGLVDAITDLWDNVNGLVPFGTCIMDVLVSHDANVLGKWRARIIEFAGFGAHLNTGSDLFHWVTDAEILHGKRPEIIVRFVDDWEEHEEAPAEEKVQIIEPKEEQKPDWLALEEKIKANFSATQFKKREGKLPLRGLWSGSY
jgi:hypothetical protein